MSTMYRYALPGRADRVEVRRQHRDVLSAGNTTTAATALLQLYDKGKRQQWDAAERIDWSQDLDPENPMLLDDRVIPIHGTDLWNKMTDKERPRSAITCRPRKSRSSCMASRAR